MRKEILSFEQISAITGVAGRLGITKIRITGGEPLVRRDIGNLVGMIAKSWNFQEICMTTNGSLLTPSMAFFLKNAGLQRVNISLDTLDPERFRIITRGGNLQNVLEGIGAALEAGLTPVKINIVVSNNTGPEEIGKMSMFCDNKGLVLQKIARFSLTDRDDVDLPVGTTQRPPACAACSRLRLTADGYLKPCLFLDNEIKIDFSDIEGCIRAAVARKPHYGIRCSNRTLSQVGG